MSKNRFQRNNNEYTKSGQRRHRDKFIPSPTKTKERLSQETDKLNRENVVKEISDIIKKGKNLNDAIIEVYSNEEIRNQFAYLENAGIDLKKVFLSWYTGFEKRKKEPINFYMNGNSGGKWER